MGVRVPLSGPDLGFDEIVVVGVSERSAVEDGRRLAETVRGHLYTRGLGFPPLGAPTNNTDATAGRVVERAGAAPPGGGGGGDRRGPAVEQPAGRRPGCGARDGRRAGADRWAARPARRARVDRPRRRAVPSPGSGADRHHDRVLRLHRRPRRRSGGSTARTAPATTSTWSTSTVRCRPCGSGASPTACSPHLAHALAAAPAAGPADARRRPMRRPRWWRCSATCEPPWPCSCRLPPASMSTASGRRPVRPVPTTAVVRRPAQRIGDVPRRRRIAGPIGADGGPVAVGGGRHGPPPVRPARHQPIDPTHGDVLGRLRRIIDGFQAASDALGRHRRRAPGVGSTHRRLRGLLQGRRRQARGDGRRGLLGTGAAAHRHGHAGRAGDDRRPAQGPGRSATPPRSPRAESSIDAMLQRFDELQSWMADVPTDQGRVDRCLGPSGGGVDQSHRRVVDVARVGAAADRPVAAPGGIHWASTASSPMSGRRRQSCARRPRGGCWRRRSTTPRRPPCSTPDGPRGVTRRRSPSTSPR